MNRNVKTVKNEVSCKNVFERLKEIQENFADKLHKTTEYHGMCMRNYAKLAVHSLDDKGSHITMIVSIPLQEKQTHNCSIHIKVGPTLPIDKFSFVITRSYQSNSLSIETGGSFFFYFLEWEEK